MNALMPPRTLARRAWHKWRRLSIERYGRRPFELRAGVPYVSFTFDDFPRTAWLEGGRLLADHGARGTYFVSCGLLDRASPSGQIVSSGDLSTLVAEGHELGCHTFEHLDGRVASAAQFEQSIAANLAALRRDMPEAVLPVFAYPLDGPVLGVKRAVGEHFVACRGGGQTFNSGSIDLNLLKAFFFDWKTQDAIDDVEHLVARNAEAGGWLIFATHDIARQPSRYGCTPEFFERAVRLATASGAEVLPMAQVLRRLGLVGEPRHLPRNGVAS